ncbi:hypothetical protein JOC37_000556 [Desulfohalotomaculum tongense]|uniref:caspase family protein n=1 Tax=Desulforadius tongensis TaxID=1216062 RepID=UPI00195C5E7F|nr:hypothetical protein [Desulforadius tongensis]
MADIRGFVVGVSNYTNIKVNNLPFCRNDISAVKKALVSGLKMKTENIITFGETGFVNSKDFINGLIDLCSHSMPEDTVIFYFSGHGTTQLTGHHLVFSDATVSTQAIINFLDKIKAKNKIIILDCCMSGNFTIDQSAKFSIYQTVEEFAGKGYAVLASSNAVQYSFRHPDKAISLFTSFLCDALQDKCIIRNGKKSLYDIVRLVSLYLEIWNKRNPTMQQQPIFRANMGGTILFNVEEYKPYYRKRVYEENERYVIYDVEPLHSSRAKRYTAKVILNEPFSFDEITDISIEIKEKIRYIEVYPNEKSQSCWLNKLANIIWICYGRDEGDIVNCNYICCATWVDETQDEKWWYKLDKYSFVNKDIHFTIHPYYEVRKSFILESTVDKEVLISQTKKVMSELITLAEKVIALYNELKNNNITENEMLQKMDILIPEIDKAYYKEIELGIAPNEIHSWQQGCSNLAGTIHDLTLFYNKKYINQRTSKNRKDCMETTIQRYYSDLGKIVKLEKDIWKT